MVIYFRCSDPRYIIYMGRDKHENEELIANMWPEHDLWFHVDKLSSAHVYLRLPEEHVFAKGKEAAKEGAKEGAKEEGAKEDRGEPPRTAAGGAAPSSAPAASAAAAAGKGKGKGKKTKKKGKLNIKIKDEVDDFGDFGDIAAAVEAVDTRAVTEKPDEPPIPDMPSALPPKRDVLDALLGEEEEDDGAAGPGERYVTAHEALDCLPEHIVAECAQLTKHNSISGTKLKMAPVIYTPAANLHKDPSTMEVGAVSMHNGKLVRKIDVVKDKQLIKELEATREERDVDLAGERRAMEKRAIMYRKKVTKERAVAEKERAKRLAKEKELRAYTFMDDGPKKSNRDYEGDERDVNEIEEDFM